MPTEKFRDGRLLLIKLGPLGQFANNAYVVADTGTNDALIVDAPEESEQVVAAARGLNVRRIIVTHRHRDHRAGIDVLLPGIDAPPFCPQADPPPAAPRGRRTCPGRSSRSSRASTSCRTRRGCIPATAPARRSAPRSRSTPSSR